MASLRRLPNSPFWIGCFTLPNGVRTQRSTKETDRRKARRIVEAWDDASREARQGRLTEDQARKVISDIYQLATEDRMPSSTIKDYFTRWLARKELEVNATTGERYHDGVKMLLANLGEHAEWDLTRLTSKVLAGFRDEWAKRLAVNTVNLTLRIIHAGLADARRDGLVLSNEAEKVPRLKRRQEPGRRPFTLAELKLLLAAASDEWRGLILFGLYTGQRLGDIANLTWANLDLQEQEIRFPTAKTGRNMVIPIAKPLLHFVESMPANDDPAAPLFPHSCGQRTGTLSNQFHNIMVAAGLVPKRSHKAYRNVGRDAKRAPSQLSYHCLRHTSTSLLKNAGVSDVIARDIIGHDSSAVSALYTHIETGTKRAAIDKMPDVTQ